MTYSNHDRALVAAAVERYGEAAGLKVLASAFDLRPSRNSVHVWVREQGITTQGPGGASPKRPRHRAEPSHERNAAVH